MGNPEGETEDGKDPTREDDIDESSEEEDGGQVEAAVLARSKRATAGRRLTDLVGKAAEDDQAFWGHDTWAEEGSDNDSFRESDEDPEHRVDAFDSDFDDSENDNDDEEVADGEREDVELAQEEKKSQRQRSNKYDVGKAARDLGRSGSASGKGQHWSGPARILGDGDNAGIVLNLPPSNESGKLYEIPGVAISPFFPSYAAKASPGDPLPSISSATPTTTEGPTPELTFPTENEAPELTVSDPQDPPSNDAKPISHSSHDHFPAPIKKLSGSASQPRPPRRATEHSKYSSRFRVARNLPMGHHHNNHATRGQGDVGNSPPTFDVAPSSTAGSENGSIRYPHKRKFTAPERAGDKGKRHRTDFTQDQLLMEAVHETAPENHRWLLGRKRAADEMEYMDKLAAAAGKGGAGGGDRKLVQRYSSRRGTLNVVSFYEMDYVPSIFTKQQLQEKDRTIAPCVCVVTGKPARYRDPKSGLPYYDKDAFIVLRKRMEDGRLKPASKQQDEKKKRSVTTSRTATPCTTASDYGSDAHDSDTAHQKANGTTTEPSKASITDDGVNAKPSKSTPAAKAKPKATTKRVSKKKAETDSAPKPRAAPKNHAKKTTNKDAVQQSVISISATPVVGQPSVPVSTESSVGSGEAPVSVPQPAVSSVSSNPPVHASANGSVQSADPAAPGQFLSSNSDPFATNGATATTSPKSRARKTLNGTPGKSMGLSSISAQSILGPGEAPTLAIDGAMVVHSASQLTVATGSTQTTKPKEPNASTNGSGAASNPAPAQAALFAAHPALCHLTSAVTPTKVQSLTSPSQTVLSQKELYLPSTPVTPTIESLSASQTSAPPLSSVFPANTHKQLPVTTATLATTKCSPLNKLSSKNTPMPNQNPVQLPSTSPAMPAIGSPSIINPGTQAKPQINLAPVGALAPATKTPKTKVASTFPLCQTKDEPPEANSNSSESY